MARDLRITLEPVVEDPLRLPDGLRPWEPWPPKIAEQRFMAELQELLESANPHRAGDREET
jgi:hypothetical protein